ncbi:MAG: HD domain-containing phosphohydrolase [Bacillota bacterium]
MLENNETEQGRRVNAVGEVARLVNTGLDLISLLNITVDLAVNLLDVPVAYIRCRSYESDQEDLFISRGLSQEHSDHITKDIVISTFPSLSQLSEFPLTVKGDHIGTFALGIDASNMSSQDAEVIKSFCNLLGIALENDRLFSMMRLAFSGTVQTLMRVVELRDPYNTGHMERVGNYAAALARQLGMPQRKIEELRLAGYLHDVGKIGVPQEVLNKRLKLSEKDLVEIKKHPVIGAEIIHSIPELRSLAAAVRYHHERLDGSGYPEGIPGDVIPYEAKLLAVVDVYEALLSQRAYHEPVSPREALEVLRVEARGRLDPKIVDAFCDVVRNDPFLLAEINPARLSHLPLKSPNYLLTRRETEILKLITEGLSNKEIAVALYISEKTVKVHISNILRKLNVTDRTKAAVMALQSGLV